MRTSEATPPPEARPAGPSGAALLGAGSGVPDRLRARVLPRVGQPGRLRGRLREEPRPPLAARPVLGRAPRAVPALQPYDPDRPPAPPDDYATEQLSPVPQWPDNRLLVPAEGTGYLDMLEAWQRQRPPACTGPPAPPPGRRQLLRQPDPDAAAPRPPGPDRPVAVRAAPVRLRGEFRADRRAVDASSLTGPARPRAAPPPRRRPHAGPGDRPRGGPQTRTRPRDAGVTLAAFQQTGLPMPVPPPADRRPATPPRRATSSRRRSAWTPRPTSKGPTSPPRPTPARPDPRGVPRRRGDGLRDCRASSSPAPSTSTRPRPPASPRTTTPYVITMDQAFTLALINSRVYQFQLENIYIASLAVTLQRFAFTPQFYAGLSPADRRRPYAGRRPSPGGLEPAQLVHLRDPGDRAARSRP